MKQKISLFFLVLTLSINFSLAQNNLWNKNSSLKKGTQNELTFTLNFNQLTSLLEKSPMRGQNNLNSNLILEFPSISGKMVSYNIVEVPALAPELSAKYPDIRSFRGVSMDGSHSTLSFSTSKKGLNATIYSLEKKTISIEKKSDDLYHVFEPKIEESLNKFECLTENASASNLSESGANRNFTDGLLRTYRIAVSADGEFTGFNGGTVASTLTAINDLMTIINPVYERELAITFQLIANNDAIIFTDANTDPYSGTIGINAIIQTTIDNNIESENYDIGILFSGRLGGGNAGAIGSVCDDESKGSAYAGDPSNPSGYVFAMVIAHEMGHQFGANHTFSRPEYLGFDGNVNANREPGSGTSIMSYAGVTTFTDVESAHIDQFHNYSINQIKNYILSTDCAATMPIANEEPIVDAGENYTIPKGTAFKLTAVGNDPDGDAITYSWEQDDPRTGGVITELYNPYAGYTVPDPSKAEDAINFQVYKHTTNPYRYFPAMNYILAGNLYPTWDMISDVAREINFKVQARDNSPLGGQTASDNMTVTVTDDGPFKITSINKNDGLPLDESHTLTWDVAGTNTGAINVSNVNILFSSDGGETFVPLIENTPNDGSEVIMFPSNAEMAYIKVEAVDNIFFAMSPLFAVGYEVTVECKEYHIAAPVAIPNDATLELFPLFQLGSVGSNVVTTINVPDAGIIEDVNVKMDVSGGNVHKFLAFIKSPNGKYKRFFAGLLDNQFNSTPSNCSDNKAQLLAKFDQEGESFFINCGTNGESIQPTSESFEDYYGSEQQGTWTFLFRELQKNADGQNTINAMSLEFCTRSVELLSNKEIEPTSEVAVYPNPTSGEVNVDWKGSKGSYINATLYDLTGKLIYSNQLNAKKIKLDFSSLLSGVYILQLDNGVDKVSKKIIKK